MVNLSMEEIHYMNEFEKITKVMPLLCISKRRALYFLVNEENFPKVVGKGGSKIKVLERKFNKKINIIKNSNDLNTFVQNILYPLRVFKLSDEKDMIFIMIDKKSVKNQSILLDKKEVLETLLKDKFKKNVKVI